MLPGPSVKVSFDIYMHTHAHSRTLTHPSTAMRSALGMRSEASGLSQGSRPGHSLGGPRACQTPRASLLPPPHAASPSVTFCLRARGRREGSWGDVRAEARVSQPPPHRPGTGSPAEQEGQAVLPGAPAGVAAFPHQRCSCSASSERARFF